VRLVAQQHALARFPQFAVGDVAHTLQRKLAIADRFDLNHCLDCQNSSVLCLSQDLAGPNPLWKVSSIPLWKVSSISCVCSS
jgi:hypothetical protein